MDAIPSHNTTWVRKVIHNHKHIIYTEKSENMDFVTPTQQIPKT